MMAAAWILVCIFGCKLYGGFVRDWIVGQQRSRPKNKTIDQWVLYDQSPPHLHPELVPADLDCYLPSHGLYEIDEILNELGKLKMLAKVHRHYWRYALLVDENTKTGPFIIDLIIPNIKGTQYDRIDFDINNLFVEKDYTQHLGMRIDITCPPHSITLENIVDHIQKQSFHFLGEINDKPSGKILSDRLNKMITRGWTQINPALPSVMPSLNPPSNSTLTPLSKDSSLYQKLEKLMKSSFLKKDLEILSIEQIKNTELENIYIEAQKIIATQSSTSDGNEVQLFHGAKGN
ncbi:unnamed protein product [Rotaria sp. Silwood2]|nr:unnamed protein product [Rotaria sp. Silwood2]CAF2941216.1 unnamed protein product [Rotaria sp. Silwood2]CAF3313065.1 unnamed protein product [Rotaria sp. Silwood2]CAF3339483.1 unnamed protein product [Rotaria sp. Silwood2]CAF3994843.1 unnamed protein product [Rotaria sp. Silwood2]